MRADTSTILDYDVCPSSITSTNCMLDVLTESDVLCTLFLLVMI